MPTNNKYCVAGDDQHSSTHRDSNDTQEVLRREAKKLVRDAARDTRILEKGLSRIFS